MNEIIKYIIDFLIITVCVFCLICLINSIAGLLITKLEDKITIKINIIKAVGSLMGFIPSYLYLLSNYGWLNLYKCNKKNKSGDNYVFKK